MLELTQKQWQAIVQEDNPTMIEPESKTAYVIIPKDEYDKLRTEDAEAAIALRIAWMRRMGLDENEIADSLRVDPPVGVSIEMREWKALDRLDKRTPPGEVLRRYAVKY